MKSLIGPVLIVVLLSVIPALATDVIIGCGDYQWYLLHSRQLKEEIKEDLVKGVSRYQLDKLREDIAEHLTCARRVCQNYLLKEVKKNYLAVLRMVDVNEAAGNLCSPKPIKDDFSGKMDKRP